MGKYKLIERKANPLDKTSTAKKFYACPKTEKALPTRTFAKNASVGMALTPSEMEAALEQFGTKALEYLLIGHSVEIPGIGTLRITFKSEGANTPMEFNASSMIKSPRILFTAKPEVREAIRTSISYELAGIKADGREYKDMKEYKEAKGITTPSSGGSAGGGQQTTDNGQQTGGGGDNGGGDNNTPGGDE